MRRLVTTRAALLLGVLFSTAPGLLAQEPTSRAEELRRAREEKAKEVTPPESSRLERALLDLENGRLFERVLGPPQGLYPRFGNVTSGAGFSFGPGYGRTGTFGGHVDFSASALGTFAKDWLIESRVTLPRLANERLSLDAHASRLDFREADFFGIGPDSSRDDHVTYRYDITVAGVTGSYRPLPWLTVGGTADYLSPRLGVYDEPGSIGSTFTGAEVPGLYDHPPFARYITLLDVNYGRPRGNPRRGGHYSLTYSHFQDRDTGHYTFDRLDVDVRQYISLLRERRVLALRALVSTSEADAGRQVPFYLQRTLGGPDDLRGFRRFRFRDDHMLLLQAEYRWEIFTAMDGVLFYDAGKVASQRSDLTLDHLESDYGFGFRFGTNNGVFMRVEAAYGSTDGAHFILRFGDAF
jgi:hypothetical protein